MKQSLGNRMKIYENAYRFKLPIRMPIILRLDGCHFHSYTKKFNKPWDTTIRDAFIHATQVLFKEIGGYLKIAYLQSDEVNCLLTNDDTLTMEPWFDNNLNKLVSVSASILSVAFNEHITQSYAFKEYKIKSRAFFDSRVFVIPKEEVCNFFFWRQLDCIRNSVSGYAQANFSHKQLHKKNCDDMKEMLLEKKLNWEALEVWEKFGYCIIRKEIEKNNVIRHLVEPDWNTPIFSEDRNYINKFLQTG